MKTKKTHYDVNIVLKYCIGLNKGFTDNMSIATYRVENINAQSIDSFEETITDSISILLRGINSIFKIGSFRFTFNCTREESQSLHEKCMNENTQDKSVKMITDAIEKILRDFIRYTAMPSLSDILTKMDGYVIGKQPKIPDVKDIRGCPDNQHAE